MFEILTPDLIIAATCVLLAAIALHFRSKPGWAKALAPFLFGLGLIGAAVIVSLLGMVAAPWVGIPIIVVAGIAWAGWTSKNTTRGSGLFLTALFCAGVVFGYGSFIHDWRHSIEPTQKVELRPQEAMRVTGWQLVLFRRAMCRPDLKGIESWAQQDRTLTRTYAPLVAEGWARGQQVPAWISLGELPGHGDTPEQVCHVQTGSGTIAALQQRRDHHIHKAITNAMQTHGLTEFEDAKVFRFAPTEKTVRSQLGLGRAIALTLGFFWLLALGRDLRN